jgi:hypothetical protein
MSTIAEHIAEIRERIDAAASRTGRNGEEVRLMAVSKLKNRGQIEEAYRAGQRLFGENRVQEAEEKYSDFYEDAELHLIGHLQTNKAKDAVPLVSCIQSIDKLKTAQAVEKRCAEYGKMMNILLEVNTSGEESKYGYRSKEQLFEDLDRIRALEHLRVKGLMTIGPLGADADTVRRAFAGLRELFEELRSRCPDDEIDVLSMGMTSDFEYAVEEGATLVRVGTALFGERGY